MPFHLLRPSNRSSPERRSRTWEFPARYNPTPIASQILAREAAFKNEDILYIGNHIAEENCAIPKSTQALRIFHRDLRESLGRLVENEYLLDMWKAKKATLVKVQSFEDDALPQGLPFILSFESLEVKIRLIQSFPAEGLRNALRDAYLDWRGFLRREVHRDHDQNTAWNTIEKDDLLDELAMGAIGKTQVNHGKDWPQRRCAFPVNVLLGDSWARSFNRKDDPVQSLAWWMQGRENVRQPIRTLLKQTYTDHLLG